MTTYEHDNMNTNPHETITMDLDARLTAYALGELDEADAREIEQHLQSNEAARATVEQVRATADTLRVQLRAGSPMLTTEQRERVEAGNSGATASRERRSPVIFTFARAGGGIAAAAAIALTAVAGWWFFGSADDANTLEVAREDTTSTREGAVSSRPTPAERMRAGGPDLSMAESKQHRFSLPEPGASSGVAGQRGSELYSIAPSAPPPPPAVAQGLVTEADGWSYRDDATDMLAAVSPADEEELRSLDRDEYNRIVDNPFIAAIGEGALSTFSIDVDTASYSNMRRYLNSGVLPPPDAVRIEELVNYFMYDYTPPSASDVHPFSVDVAAMPAPWKPEHRLVRIGLKGLEVDTDKRPATNLVFLLDVSGSMNSPDKLPLLKQSFKMLIDELNGDDRVAIVVYAGASGLVLPSTYCEEKDRIMAAIDNLSAGGSTNGGAGIELAYQVASESYIDGGVNRVILATDGDFNVGVSSEAQLVRLIEEKRTSGVYLSVLGFGRGNYQDAKMEELSNKGNGNAAYIDSEREARKALVEQLSGTLVTIAKDVKIQVEFNPAHVQAYRLIGYENRMLAAQDFNDDTKDAGEIGAGLTVTALYEVVPPGVDINLPDVDALKYQPNAEADAAPTTGQAGQSPELLTVKLRYKTPETPEGGKSIYLDVPFIDSGMTIAQAPDDLKFASAVAGTGMILRRSPYRGNATLDVLLDLAEQSAGADQGGYRAEFIQMMRQASELLPPELTTSSAPSEGDASAKPEPSTQQSPNERVHPVRSDDNK